MGKSKCGDASLAFCSRVLEPACEVFEGGHTFFWGRLCVVRGSDVLQSNDTFFSLAKFQSNFRVIMRKEDGLRMAGEQGMFIS